MGELVAIIDYGSGNLRSAEKAVARAGDEAGLECEIVVTDDADLVRKADRVILPGVGAFADCRRGLFALTGMVDALTESVIEKARPFLGICVGMQLMAEEGHEHGVHKGLGWIKGTVKPIKPADPGLKVPHMGWNEINLSATGSAHPLTRTVAPGDHTYFVHSYHMDLGNDAAELLAMTQYGETLTAIVGRDNMVGTQFHPEKSQDVGQKFLRGFLEWQP